MSPIMELRRELLPDPTAPITQTNSPFLMVRLRLLRIKSSFSFAKSIAESSGLSISSSG